MDADRLSKMRWAAPLLPEPGPEVVVELLDEIERLRAEASVCPNCGPCPTCTVLPDSAIVTAEFEGDDDG